MHYIFFKQTKTLRSVTCLFYESLRGLLANKHDEDEGTQQSGQRECWKQIIKLCPTELTYTEHAATANLCQT